MRYADCYGWHTKDALRGSHGFFRLRPVTVHLFVDDFTIGFDCPALIDRSPLRCVAKAYYGRSPLPGYGNKRRNHRGTIFAAGRIYSQGNLSCPFITYECPPPLPSSCKTLVVNPCCGRRFCPSRYVASALRRFAFNR